MVTKTKGHVKLRAYMRGYAANDVDFANLAGITPMQLSHLICDRRGASIEVAAKIEKATDGFVPMRLWAMKLK